jgi:hypothetical protein
LSAEPGGERRAEQQDENSLETKSHADLLPSDDRYLVKTKRDRC